MAFQTVFKRYELKYLLSTEQMERILQGMSDHMIPDSYGQSIVRNIYFDTDNYRLIRRSMEKPAYKEKLRIRSYTQVNAEDTVFVELKKKYEGVVYKRRVSMSEQDAISWLCGQKECPVDTQISREIDYFVHHYGNLKPTMFLSYCRQAYFDRDGGGFRITFDQNIQARRSQLRLCEPVFGVPLISEDKVLMELKCAGGIPLWMVKLLSREGLYKTSFSKYGCAYTALIFPEHSGKAKEIVTYGLDI